jgi:hypothetical protein
MAAKTNLERQKEYMERLKAAGNVQVSVWIADTPKNRKHIRDEARLLRNELS